MFYQLLIQRIKTQVVLERVVALILDASISLALSIIPVVGYIVGALYFFLKDALPFSNGESFGKHLYQLKLVDRETTQDLGKGKFEKSIIRSLILITPIINIIDIVYFIKHEHRLADEWVNTSVIKKENQEA
jgi:RDD family.